MADAVGGVEDGGEMTGDLAGTASWAEGDQGLVFWDVVPVEESVAGKFGFGEVGEGVADVGGGDAVGAEERLLEGEDHEQVVDDAAHEGKAILAPRPDLGGDQVDDGNPTLFQLFGDTKVEVGAVGEDGQAGLFGIGFGQ